MTTITEHLTAWGCPAKYAADFSSTAPWEFRALIDAVRSAANWYPEQTGAVCEMVRRGDANALRSWDRDALVQIGRETDDEGGDGEDYADAVMEALEQLADVVEARKSDKTE